MMFTLKDIFLTFIIPDRDGTESLIKAKITSDRTFEVPINIDQYAPGKYSDTATILELF